MNKHLILLSIPGLRASDINAMPKLRSLFADGGEATLSASFPAVTCPVQINMTTGKRPSEHGVVANGFYWRDKNEVEMWTAWNKVVARPQLWSLLRENNPTLISAVWFPLLAKGCDADYICTPAPIHNPDGSESLWCYTKPEALYGELRDTLGHFPLKHFWGPLANISGTDWIVDSAIVAAKQFQPNLFYIYLPHLDYAAQKNGPDSPEAHAALQSLDIAIGRLIDGMNKAYAKSGELHWLAASEYTIVPVDHVAYPNRVLREAGLLKLQTDNENREEIDFASTPAWAMVDHQLSHVFVRNGDKELLSQVVNCFNNKPGIAAVLTKEGQREFGLDHERSGEIVLVSEPNSWQAYYWWQEDANAPSYARTVDIHRKPGYDPVELFFDAETRGIPLDATLVQGSHGAPVTSEAQRGVLLASHTELLAQTGYTDTDVAGIVMSYFLK